MRSEDRGGDEPVDSVGEEAAKLLQALQDWAGENLDGHIATGSAECTYCPLCRVISALRDSPEVWQHVSRAATSVMEVVAGVLAPDPGDERPAGGEEG